MPPEWNKDLQLVALDGDVDRGSAILLDAKEPLTIGRSSRGLRLLDPLVSIQHAKIEFDERRGYVVTDLDSATGTWVDEQLIQNDSRPIGLGTRLRFGDTVFEVRKVRRVPPWAVGVLAASVAVCLVAMLVFVVAQAPSGRPMLQWTGPIRQSATLTSDILDVPVEFARERGLDVAQLRVRRVTDRDYDGLDEVWFRDGTRGDFVVGFTVDGQWRDLGSFPVDCHDMSGEGASNDGFPVLDCAGILYSMVDGKYQSTGHAGVVVWVTPNAPPSPESPAPEAPVAEDVPVEAPVEQLPRPMRVVMRDTNRLAGFLAERGVNEPIHYLICEDAFPGIKAQVLTAAGQLRTLSYGCVGGLYLSQPESGRPVAAAFTAAGHRALLDDVTAFYGGNAEGTFLPEAMRPRIDEARRSPGYERGSVKLSTDASPTFVEPLASEGTIAGVRALLSKDPRRPASPVATVATIVTEGTADLDPPGCTKLRVRTEAFRCSGWCTDGAQFLTVEEIGCGDARRILELPYAGGTADAVSEDLDLRAVVESSGTHVLRARIAWRGQGR